MLPVQAATPPKVPEPETTSWPVAAKSATPLNVPAMLRPSAIDAVQLDTPLDSLWLDIPPGFRGSIHEERAR